MRKGLKNILFLGVIAILISSCQFRKYEKSQDWRVKYEAALQYYEEEEYYRASVLFEQILPIVRGLPEGEQVQFQLAYCNYYQGMNILASHHFKTFFETYGRSSLVQEARYMYAYALYADSPDSNLDQTSTEEALAAMQNFINRYPGSEFRDDATLIIDEIQSKLERKGYDNAYQYYKLRFWSAAVVALENFQNDYPDSELCPEAEYYRIMAQFNYAEQSVFTKQEERYKEVVSFYEKFIDRFPDNEFISEAEKAYSRSLREIQKLATNN